MPTSKPLASRGPPPGRPSLEARRAETKRKRLTALGILVGGLAVIIGLGVAFAPRIAPAPEDTVPEARPVVVPAETPQEKPGVVAPLDALGRARAEATTWQADAALVSIQASPVVRGKVDLGAGGHIDYVFGAPTGQGFGVGARVKPDGLTVRLNADGSRKEETRLKSMRASAAPNCSLAEACKEVTAAGVAADAKLDASFLFSPQHDRAVWRITVEGGQGAAHVVDGWSCNILVR